MENYLENLAKKIGPEARQVGAAIIVPTPHGMIAVNAETAYMVDGSDVLLEDQSKLPEALAYVEKLAGLREG